MDSVNYFRLGHKHEIMPESATPEEIRSYNRGLELFRAPVVYFILQNEIIGLDDKSRKGVVTPEERATAQKAYDSMVEMNLSFGDEEKSPMFREVTEKIFPKSWRTRVLEDSLKRFERIDKRQTVTS